MKRTDIKPGLRFRIKVHTASTLRDVWVCIDLGKRHILAVKEKVAIAKLRKTLGDGDDVVSSLDLVKHAPTFDDFLVLWDEELVHCTKAR